MDPVRLEVTFSVDDASVDPARTLLEQELAGIARDLELPIQPAIERHSASGLDVALSVDGRPASARPPWVAWPTETAPHRLASLLHANAIALITPAVVERL